MKNTFLVALRAIYINKGRSLLTMLGVIIGVSSVVLLTAIGNGLQVYITQQFESLGSNNIIISPGQIFNKKTGSFGDRSSQASSLSNNKLKQSDVNDIRKLREHISYVSFANTVSDEAKFLDKTKTVTVIGTTEDYPKIFSTKLTSGNFFTKTDDESAQRVAIIGAKVHTELFGTADPIGKRMQVGNQQFTVIGVVEAKGGGFGGPSFDDYVYIPYHTLSQTYDTQAVLEIIAKARSKEEIPAAISAIEKQLLKRLKDTDFSVFDQTEILKTINQILGMLTVGLGGIAAISLLVGGIGIMNIMLVSVTERTREIGLRKALGATPHQILIQFLIEAALLSVLGGLIGLALAYLGSLAIQAVFPAQVSLGSIVLAFGVSVAVGLIFGAAPASRASKLSPIEALRYE